MAEGDYGPSQSDHRALGEFTDQHGRQWEANTENKTRHPCGPLRPQFEAPFYPFTNYITVLSPTRVRIEYKTWLNDMDEANREYDAGLQSYAFQLYGDQAAKSIKDPPPELMAIVGERPQRVPREFVEASLQENQWILGFAKAVPDWAIPLLEKAEEQKTEPELAAYPDADEEVKVVSEGFSLKQAGENLWHMPDGTSFKGNRSGAMDHLEEHFPEEYAEFLVEV